MDPTANLKEQRELAESLLTDDPDRPVDGEDARRLAELVTALDDWLAKGGYLPRSWRLAGLESTRTRA